jgi:dienelactone hydrolase
MPFTSNYKLSIICFFLLFSFTWKFSNAQQSFEITFNHDGKNVLGTFTKPNGTGRFPTIIINPGSGANDRYGTIVMEGANSACLYPDLFGDTLRPYKDLSDALVDSGYAVLRYDKLEYSYPTSLGVITFHKLWLPVESAINYIKTRIDVDTSKIILIGHSEGSSLIPYIAKGRSDIKALISLAGPRTPLDSILSYQLNNIAQLCGGDIAQTQAQTDQILSYFTTIRNGTWNGTTPTLFGVSASAWEDYIHVVDSVSYHYNNDNLPTLFLGLGQDFNVPPSELTRFENEITCTNDFWSIPDLTHYLTPINNPQFSETVADTIVYWLRQQNISAGISSTKQESDVFDCFPNPFQSALNISIPNKKGSAYTLSIRSMIGQELFKLSDTVESNGYVKTLDCEFLPEGLYLMELILDGNRNVKKLIKK